MVVNNPLIRPYFLGGGGIGGVPLDSHDTIWYNKWPLEHSTVTCGRTDSSGKSLRRHFHYALGTEFRQNLSVSTMLASFNTGFLSWVLHIFQYISQFLKRLKFMSSSKQNAETTSILVFLVFTSLEGNRLEIPKIQSFSLLISEIRRWQSCIIAANKWWNH